MILVQIQNLKNRIGGVMASVLALSVIDCESRSGQTRDYKTGICSFSHGENKLIVEMMMRSALF
jgi:hypothetical protein